jgi:O-antigen/teichoic acid export membrane protein
LPAFRIPALVTAGWRRPGLRGFLLNAAGNLVPLAAALVALPVIAHLAGSERLGMLGLAWTLIGYLGLLDFGLSRIVVRRVARATTEQTLSGEADLVVRLCLWLGLGVIPAALLIAWLLPSDTLASGSLTSDELRPALWLLLAALPAVIVTGLLRGVLEGQQRFAIANAVKVLLGLWSFGAPAVVAVWQPTLPALVGAVVVGRLVGVLLHAWVIREFLARRLAHDGPRVAFRPLVREGGWLTVSNVVGPLMVTFDRFAIGAMLSLKAVAYYMVPQEFALRVLTLPMALSSTAFPMLARRTLDGTAQRQDLAGRSVMAALVLSLLPSLVMAAAAEPALRLWMGAEFADASAAPAAILAVGLFANCVAQIPFTALQAAGRADVTGRVHLVEVPIYVALLAFALTVGGITGAAVVWTLRTAADAVAMFWLAQRLGLMTLERDDRRGLCAAAALVASVAAAAVLLDGGVFVALVVVAGSIASFMSVRVAMRLLAMPAPRTE